MAMDAGSGVPSPVAVLAVLWLLLISGAALKWAGLPASSSRIFGFAQIVLSSGVVVFGVVAVLINSAWAVAACRVRCRRCRSGSHMR